MKSGHSLASAKPEASDCAYNLFRNKQWPRIYCAVPEEYPIPCFIESEQWAYVETLRSGDPRPPEFGTRAATTGVQFNGFYLFYVPTTQWITRRNSLTEAVFSLKADATLPIRQHVRKALLQLLAKHTSPDQVIEYVSRSAADQKTAEACYAPRIFEF